MPDWLRDWWPVVLLGLPMLVAAIGWAVRKGLVTHDTFATALQERDAKIAAESQSRAELSSAVARIEFRLTQMPSRDDLHGLSVSLAEFRGDLKAMRTGMSGLEGSMERMDRTLTRHEAIFAEGKR